MRPIVSAEDSGRPAGGERVTVIIATAGTEARSQSLIRAIDSLRGQKPIRPKVLVVFNGPGVLDDLVASVRRISGVDVKCLDQPSLPNALNYGRRCVDTEYFGFLDDDDIYLPNALAVRCNILDEREEIDVVATNGIVNTQSGKSRLLPEGIRVEKDPLAELFRQNWLASCGGLYRTSTVDERYFPVYAKYFEWTMTAFLLAMDRKSTFVDEPTFVINETAGSLSASDGYVEAYPNILRRMLEFPVEKRIQRQISERLSRALHAASVRSQERGMLDAAWRYHIDSLRCRGGLKYLAYTRKLLV
jgi:glycosyltransferase involved in cell wall biosynthesis